MIQLLHLIQLLSICCALPMLRTSAWTSSLSSSYSSPSISSRIVVDRASHHRRRRSHSHLRVLSSGDDEEEKFVDNDDAVFKKPKRQQQQRSSSSINDMMIAMNTSPRRLSIGILSASGIALAGNFLGVTSRLLTLFPEEKVEASRIDTYFPRGNYKRCLTKDYTFVIPASWVADTFVELAKAQRLVQPLDYAMKSSRPSARSTLPDSAYGPPGRLNPRGVSESGDTNVSVIVAEGLLTKGNNNNNIVDLLGPPQQAAENLLSKSIAPEGSGRVATLVESSIVEKNGVPYYRIEYVVDFGARRPPLQNIAIICGETTRSGNVITLTAVAPVSSWQDPKTNEMLRKIADSFHLR